MNHDFKASFSSLKKGGREPNGPQRQGILNGSAGKKKNIYIYIIYIYKYIYNIYKYIYNI